jgi:hypothetical protein
VKIGSRQTSSRQLARHGLHGTGRIEPHFGGALFVGAARKI